MTFAEAKNERGIGSHWNNPTFEMRTLFYCKAGLMDLSVG
jgi:hypothetical protein